MPYRYVLCLGACTETGVHTVSHLTEKGVGCSSSGVKIVGASISPFISALSSSRWTELYLHQPHCHYISLIIYNTPSINSLYLIIRRKKKVRAVSADTELPIPGTRGLEHISTSGTHVYSTSPGAITCSYRPFS